MKNTSKFRSIRQTSDFSTRTRIIVILHFPTMTTRRCTRPGPVFYGGEIDDEHVHKKPHLFNQIYLSCCWMNKMSTEEDYNFNRPPRRSTAQSDRDRVENVFYCEIIVQYICVLMCFENSTLAWLPLKVVLNYIHFVLVDEVIKHTLSSTTTKARNHRDVQGTTIEIGFSYSLVEMICLKNFAFLCWKNCTRTK
jgi:hypothetical protein